MRKVSFLLIVIFSLCVFPYLAQAFDKTGLVLYLNMDEGKGDTLKDLSGNGNNGKLVDGEWTKGQYNGGIKLSVTKDHIEVADSDSLHIEESLTLAIWANVESIPDSACALFMKPTAYMMHTVPAGKGIQPDILVFIGGNYGPWPTPNKASAPLGEWHHFAATYDGKKFDLFIDGKRLDGYDRSPNGPIDQDKTVMFIGRDNRAGCDARNSPCSLDDAVIFNRALSEVEVKEVMGGNFLAVEPGEKLSTCWGILKDSQ
ncbi:MAG: hypothetical protein QG641_1080 [Candidatus Poribacteria bacterium]|nr:hypothetical protein [Candidatus Poribacteria bacterium]